MTKNWKKFIADIFFLLSKTTIYLSLGLHDVQLTKEAFSSQKRTSSTSKHEIFEFFSNFLGLFCPTGSGSGFRIRIQFRIHWPDWIQIQFGSGSTTLVFNIRFDACWVPDPYQFVMDPYPWFGISVRDLTDKYGIWYSSGFVSSDIVLKFFLLMSLSKPEEM